MKKLLCLLLITFSLFQSCVPVPEEDPDPVPPAGNVTANFDDQVFSSTSSQVVLNNVSLSIKASQEDGSYFIITLPEAPIIGTYTWSVYDVSSPGFRLAYYEYEGAVPYIAERDNIGAFASFPSYIDTAELVIYSIDKTNKRVSGTFRFTGVRFTDDSQTAVETREFSNGQFYSLPYTTVAVVDPVNTTVRVKKITETDFDGTVFTTEYFYIGNKLNYLVDSDGIRTNFTYEGDLIMKEEVKDGTEILEQYFYTYDNNNKLVTYVFLDLVDNIGLKIVYIHNADGTISYQQYKGDSNSQDELDYDGTISNNRYIENIINPITQEPQVFTSTFTHDDKNNPFKNVIGYSKVYFAESDEALNYSNNWLTRTEQIDSETPTLSETYIYSFDNLNYPNYPTKIIHNNGTGIEEYTEDIEYY
jgi:hypothetical protein